MSQDRSVVATFVAEGQATKLSFVVQPGAAQVNTAIAPAVQVAVQDANGATLTSRTDAITLAIGNNPGSATLGGQVTRNAVAGVATFADLTLNEVEEGYTLTALASGLTSATSASFNITTGTVAHLAFSVPPPNATAGLAIAPPSWSRFVTLSEAVLTGRTDPITISLQTNPGNSTLGGTATVAAVAGVATFSNLTLNKAAVGYRLAAGTANAGGASSNTFDVSAGTPFLMTRNAPTGPDEPQSAPVGQDVPIRPSVMVAGCLRQPGARCARSLGSDRR